VRPILHSHNANGCLLQRGAYQKGRGRWGKRRILPGIPGSGIKYDHAMGRARGGLRRLKFCPASECVRAHVAVLRSSTSQFNVPYQQLAEDLKNRRPVP